MVQTRSEETGINNYQTLQEAIDAAKKDKTIWKISFNLGGERVRLVRHEDKWIYQSLMEYLNYG